MWSSSFGLFCLACFACALGVRVNDAELGVMTLKQAMRNPNEFWDVLKMFEDPEFSEEVNKMMNDPTFREQASHAAETVAMEDVPAKTLASLLLAVNPVSTRTQRSTSARMETLAELKDYAKKLNPVIGYFDPLNLVNIDTYTNGKGQEATIGFLRHAEIKHGRVAMAAFIGYIVQSNVNWLEGSPPEQWDAMPTALKILVIQTVGALEFYGEWTPGTEHPSMTVNKDGSPWVRPVHPRDVGYKHYMKGGKPGHYPSLLNVGITPWAIDLWDPIGTVQKLSPEEKERKLLAEVNNGRLAMLGIMAFLAEAKVPGSVPLLSGIIKPYAGEVMAPFVASDNLPGVAYMSKFSLPR
jgi:hypothetical protein